VRTNLAPEDLGGFLDEPLVAVLATLRKDGSVLLSPVWHEWRDGGFNLWLEWHNVKTRHLQRDPRASLVVAESGGQLRGVELRCSVRFVEEDVNETAVRIATRYIGERGRSYVEPSRGTDLIARLEPGHLRVWDFADEYPPG
jgi:PPOX class probable F420-dependent enzyme